MTATGSGPRLPEPAPEGLGESEAGSVRKAMFGRTAVLRGALLMTGSTYITYVLGLVVSVLIARSLGPGDFGRYSYLVWLSGLLVLLANNGLTTSGIRFVSEGLGRDAPQDARRVHGWLRRGQFGRLFLVLAVFAAAMPWLRPVGWDEHLGFFAILILTSVVSKALYLFDVSIAKGYGKFVIEAVSTVSVTSVSTIAVAVLVLLGAPLEAFLALFAVASVAYAVVAALMLRGAGVRTERGPLGPALKSRVLQHLTWSLVMVSVGAFSNKSIETLLLNALIGSAEVGFFTIAAGLTRGMVEILSSGLSTVLMPSMAHAHGAGGTQRVGAILSDSVRYFQFLGLLLAGVGVLWSGPVVELMYGSRYEPVVAVFRVMVLVGGFTLADGAFGALLTITDHQRLRAAFSVFSVVISAITAFSLVPSFGLNGAIASHALSRLIVYSALVLGTVRTLSMPLPWRQLGKLHLAAAIAAALVAPCVLLLPGLIVRLLAGGAYAILFIAATIVLHTWQERDVAQLQALAARYPRVDRWIRPALGRWQRHSARHQ